MHKFWFLLSGILLLTTGCPRKLANSGAGLPDGSVSLNRTTAVREMPDFAWNPTTVFPDIDLPDVYPDPLPEISEARMSKALRLNPETMGDGSVLNDPNYDFFILEPGDYTHLERFKLTASGTEKRRRVIMSVGTAPWDRKSDERSRLDAFDVAGNYWVFYNLEFAGVKYTKKGMAMGHVSRLLDVAHCTYSHCYWRNSISGIRLYGDYNTVQFCVFADKPNLPVDIGGVGIFAATDTESRGNRVLGCEFQGMSDGVGVPWNTGTSSGSAPATIIAYNHSWVPKELYRELRVEGETFTTACAEDGYDIKNGARTNDPADRSYFIGNVSRGHRVTDQDCGGSGSPGAAWVFHRRARNWLIAGNLSYDDALGCYVKGNRGKDRVEAMVVRDNVFANLAAEFAGDVGKWRRNPDDGLALRVMCPDCDVFNNIVVNAKRDVFERQDRRARYRDNLFVNVEEGSEEGHRSANQVRWRTVRVKASPYLNPQQTITIRVPVEK